MARWRRPGAGEMLKVFLLLSVVAFILGLVWQPAVPRNDVVSFPVVVFFVWGVSRGGRISRIILIVASGVSYVAAVLAVARSWDLLIVALAIIYAAQIALLVSPAVYGRTRPAPIQLRAEGWAQLVRRPPSWLLPWGLFLGVVLTLAYLGSMDVAAAPGCRPAAAEACSVLVQGYPLRWLTAPKGTPVIDKYALVKDCAQWTLACSSVLYLAWLQLRPRPSPVPAPADVVSIRSASGENRSARSLPSSVEARDRTAERM